MLGVLFSFVKELFEIFDTKITSFNKIDCINSSDNCSQLLSKFAKNIIIKLENEVDKINLSEDNDKCITEHITIFSASFYQYIG